MVMAISISNEAYSTIPIKPNVNCPYYLPCGYCSKMMRPCINSGGYTITYTTGTSTTNIQGETNK